MFKNKTLLITGGTGSFGKNFVNYLLNKNYFKKIIIFSRDELKQYEMKTMFNNNKKLRFFLGDVRDLNRLKIAFNDVDIVVHAAALKQVDTGEYNPFEFIKTNILGAQNIIEACFFTKVRKVVALSTDKASSPINLYGATKLCSDKLFCAAKSIMDKKTLFSVVRYGNVMLSRGSVIPFFKKIKNNIYPITHSSMTRFTISMSTAIDLVMWTIKHSIGSEIIVPKIPSYKLVDLPKCFSKKPKTKIIGIRNGEKIHEEMISEEESRNCLEIDSKFIIADNAKKYRKNIKNRFNVKNFSKKFYRSNENIFLSTKELSKDISNEMKTFVF